MTKQSPVSEATLAREYRDGKTVQQLANEHHTSTDRVRRALRNEGVHARSSGHRRLRTINLDAFTDMDLDPVKSYWAGFLFADGSVDDGHHSLILGLSETDRGHVESFKEFSGSDAKIVTVPTKGYAKTNVCRFVINGKAMTQGLAKYGLVPRKSLTATVPDILLHNPDFWRGCIDGDGWIHFKDARFNLPILGLCGSLRTVQQFREFAVHVNPAVRASIHTNGENCFAITIGGTIAQSVLAAVGYGQDVIALPRKKSLAKTALAWKPHHKRTPSKRQAAG